jgi:hypothetical protein
MGKEQPIYSQYNIRFAESPYKRFEKEYCRHCVKPMMKLPHSFIDKELWDYLHQFGMDDFHVYRCDCGNYETIYFNEWDGGN